MSGRDITNKLKEFAIYIRVTEDKGSQSNMIKFGFTHNLDIPEFKYCKKHNIGTRLLWSSGYMFKSKKQITTAYERAIDICKKQSGEIVSTNDIRCKCWVKYPNNTRKLYATVKDICESIYMNT
jgi:hypothetical protein